MATSVVRSTYALDVDTVRTLDRLAERWGVSKSEALRRAVRHAAEQAAPKGQGALEALDALQHSLKLSRTKVDAWAGAVRSERRGSAARREGRPLIHLDAGFLIGALRRGSREDQQLRGWLAKGEFVGTSVVTWTEFLCGPVEAAGIDLAARVIEEPEPLVAGDALVAAHLFNLGSRHDQPR